MWLMYYIPFIPIFKAIPQRQFGNRFARIVKRIHHLLIFGIYRRVSKLDISLGKMAKCQIMITTGTDIILLRASEM